MLFWRRLIHVTFTGLLPRFLLLDQHMQSRIILLITQVSDVVLTTQSLCHAENGLSPKQILFCQRHLDIMPFIRFGTNLALEECRTQFKNRHWNCSLFYEQKQIENILDSGTKESAYVHAITAAGIAYAITKACSTGRLASCGCDMSLQSKSDGTTKWSGCSDNVLFGSEIARKFVNLRERPMKNKTSLLNIHNNQAGIKTVQSEVDRQCKCHGVSGSCEFKTCWRSLRPFHRIGNQLKEKYDDAIEVRLHHSENKLRLIARNSPYESQTKSDLVYLNQSPNYCERNVTYGSFGTYGRLCNRSSRAIDGCELLCCNRGYQSQIVTYRDKCNCRFTFCCTITCQECIQTKEISRCL
ncbi:unnamed protein product [Didymodactylos carnosus]|uniref:Protein Wnt n=1 Tax=Didymodactylos carnosus TaxID=1234261 RepID=A0A8S2GEJ5_9BILA|nr:unnamed protein product [Didymodactylos carnosus]CAF3505487.1 unnamed protein product [Didymodactylos carnosus]